MGGDDIRALKDIEEFGCHILLVQEAGEYPKFSYSIGIQKTTGQAELIVTGLKHQLAQWIINEYNNRIRAGEVFEPNKYYPGFIEGFEVTFKVVEKRHYAEYFGWAKWLYAGDDFKVFQLIYPSTAGAWPWDPAATDDYLWFLPKLYAD